MLETPAMALAAWTSGPRYGAGSARGPARAGLSGPGWLARLLLTLTLVLLLAGQAQAQPWSDGPVFPGSGTPAHATAVVVTPHVRAELVANAPDGVQAGGSFQLGLLLDHQPDWHSYWRNPGDSGMATELHWSLPAGMTAGPVDWPTPMKLRLGDLANYGYEGQVLLPVTVDVAPGWHGNGSVPVHLHATWLVCNDMCIPEEGNFVLNLPVAGSSSLYAGDFRQAGRDQPVNLPGGSGSVSAHGDRLQFRITGLPAQLHGHKLELFVEQASVIDHGARAGSGWQQHWDGDVWVADVPLAMHHVASSGWLDVVVTRLSLSEGGDWNPLAPGEAGADGPRGWQLRLPVTQGWSSSMGPGPSGQLLQALAGNQQQPAPAAAQVSVSHWLGLLGLALLGGMILNLLPCVFPVLAIKALSIARYGGARALQQRSAMAYGAGVVVSFAALGAVVMALRMFGTQLGWGFQLQSPWFVAALALLFTLMGLALAGVVGTRLWLPAGLQRGAAGAGEGSPVARSFSTGVLAVLVASPCTGPFMGAALGATLTLPVLAALPVFVAIGIGMALPFMLLVWFPWLLARLPRPGAWMETFRTAMAFPMFATVAWLLWVLAQQLGINAMAALLFGLWAISFALWLWSKRPAGGAAVTLQVLWLGALLVPLAVTALAGGYFARTAAQPPATLGLQAAAAARDGDWQAWSLQKQQQALQSGRPVFVDFTAGWCITCQYNKMTALSDPAVLAAFRQAHVEMLRADWTRRDPAITAELQALGRSGVPTYALLVPGRPPVVMAELLDRNELRRQLLDLAGTAEAAEAARLAG